MNFENFAKSALAQHVHQLERFKLDSIIAIIQKFLVI
jgi:hypothetical protein